MTGSRPPEAAQQYVDTFQRALSCVTNSVATIRGGYHPSDYPHILLLADGFPVALQGDPPLSLAVVQNYRIIENDNAVSRQDRWRVTTIGYEYRVLITDGPELLVYHWHPDARSSIVTPHLHLGSGSGATFPGLIGAHLPGGRVSVEALLRMMITELGVEPSRNDWESVLSETESRYSELRRW